MFPALETVLGLLHPEAGGVLRRGLKFQTCTNNLNIFLKNPGIFGYPTDIYIYIYIYIYIFVFIHINKVRFFVTSPPIEPQNGFFRIDI